MLLIDMILVVIVIGTALTASIVLTQRGVSAARRRSLEARAPAGLLSGDESLAEARAKLVEHKLARDAFAILIEQRRDLNVWAVLSSDMQDEIRDWLDRYDQAC